MTAIAHGRANLHRHGRACGGHLRAPDHPRARRPASSTSTPPYVQHHPLDPADAHDPLTRHLATLISRALQAVPNGDDKLRHQVELANRIAEAIATLSPAATDQHDQITDAKNLLHAIAAPPTPPAQPAFPQRPTTPLSTGALLVNGRHQPRIGHEVTHEMASARAASTCSARSSSGTACASSSPPSAS